MEVVKVNSPLRRALDSENGVLHIIISLGVLLLINFGVEEQVALALLTGLAASIGEIRGLMKKGLSFVFTWNSLIYIAAIFVVLLPGLTEYWDILPDLGKAIQDQNWAKVGTLALALINLLFQSLRGRKGD